MIRFPFRRKLQIAFVAFAVFLVGGSLISVQRAARSAAGEKAEQDFRKATRTLREMTLGRTAVLQDSVSSALADPLFRAQLGRATEHSAGLGLGLDEGTKSGADPVPGVHEVFASADLPQFRRYPVLAILSAEGALLFTKSSPERFGENLAPIGLVAGALAHGKAIELWSSENEALHGWGLIPPKGAGTELYLVAAQSVSSGGSLLGFVIAGEPVSSTLLPQVEQSSNSEVAVTAADGKTVATGVLRNAPEALSELGSAADAARPERVSSDELAIHHVSIGGSPFLALAAPIHGIDETSTIGRAYLFRSLDAEVGPFLKRVNLALVAILVVSLAIGFAIASALARRLTGPLAELEQGVRAVRLGDLSVQVAVRGQDEIGALGGAVNDMIVGLRERNLDGLTRIYNKRYLLDSLDGMFQRSREHSLPLTLLFFDLDHFKNVNDTYGHDAGDFVLKEFTKLVQRYCKRREDLFARYGGEEFVFVLLGVEREAARVTADAIRAEVAEHAFEYEGKRLPVTTSMGVAQLDRSMDSPTAMLKAADKALYVSKTGGRNKVTVAEFAGG